MALVGFANTLSLEGKKHNIFVNTIAPAAYTRMTKNLMPPGWVLMQVEFTAADLSFCRRGARDEAGFYHASRCISLP